MNMLFEEINATELRNRLKVDLLVINAAKKENGNYETIKEEFNERELKEIIYILNDYLNILNKLRKE